MSHAQGEWLPGVCLTGFGATFVGFFDLNYWLRESPLSVVDNHIELGCQSKATDATDVYKICPCT